MGIQETRFIERLQFFDGQRLNAPDLQGLEAFNREMRWLHNQSLHQPGIGNGFAVSGKKGDRQVTIGPGYALDSLGREIVLTETRLEAVPAIAGEENGDPVFYYLTVSYPEDADLKEAETRQGICLRGGVVRLREEPEFCWVRLQRDDQGNLQPKIPKLQNDLKDGLKIVLARAEVLNCQLNQDLALAERRRALPSCRPYIASGSVELVHWDSFPIIEEQPVNLTTKAAALISPTFVAPYGLKTEVDTSQAGFLTIPAYTAQIVGPRIKQISAKQLVIVDGLISLSNPKPTGFGVEVLVVMQEVLIKDESDTKPNPEVIMAVVNDPKPKLEMFLALFSDWNIAWMGVEG
jgi:hypothetical protein